MKFNENHFLALNERLFVKTNVNIAQDLEQFKAIKGYKRLHKAIHITDKQGYSSFLLAKPYERSHKSDNFTYIPLTLYHKFHDHVQNINP